MASTFAERVLTLDEFLAAPEEKPYREYLRGQVTEKPMPTDLHGAATSDLIGTFWVYLRETGEGVVRNEVRHADRPQDWVFLPDVEIRAKAPPQARGAVEGAPPFAIEVLSPDDRPAVWLERVDLYMASGTQLLWVVDPEAETIRVYRPGEAAHTYRAGDMLDARPVLSDFRLDLEVFFARVREAAGQAAILIP
jgi:Uma2 family endonuclease